VSVLDAPARMTLWYLPAMLELEERGVVPRKVRLKERFEVSMPSVRGAVRRLERDGYVVVNERSLSLTDDGRALAMQLLRRQRLVERFLFDVVGVDWDDLGEEATRLARVVSDDVDDALTDLLGDPVVCPHGDPIPALG
jgi:DtxR family Mn-dependent transcriptional regulator